MDGWLGEVFRWFPSGPLFYLLLFFISLVESLAFAGILFPGSVLIVLAGFLAANGKGEFPLVFAASTLGAIAGDLLSYLAGVRLAPRLLTLPLLQRYRGLLERAAAFFAAHGGKSVFFGRFVGFLRPFIPFIAGSSGMRPLPFGIYAVVSGLLWGFAYPGLGFLGGASWQMVQVWTGRFSLLLALLLGLLLLNALIWRYLVPLLARLGRMAWRQLTAGGRSLLAHPMTQALQRRYPRFSDFCAARFSPRHPGGLYFTVGFLCSLLFTALFLQVGRIVYLEQSLTHLDQRVYELLQLLHHPFTDAFFVAVTMLGSLPAILALGAVALLALALTNRDFSAMILLIGIAGGQLLVAALKQLFDRPRPLPYFAELAPADPSFPSGHAFISMVFFGLMIYFLLGSVSNWRSRIALLFSGSFLVLLIAVSRIYLGLHWTSDVLAGLLLAGLWLTFLITTCEARFRYGGFYWRRGWRPLNIREPLRYAAVCLALVAACVGIGVGIDHQLTRLHLGERPRPLQRLPAGFGLDALPGLAPLHSETLNGKPQRPLSLLLAANPADLDRVLRVAGWLPAAQPLPALLTAAADGSPAAPAILPRLVQGRMADASYVRHDAGALCTLQLWDLGLRLADGRSVWGALASRQFGRRALFGRLLSLPLTTATIDRERDALAAQLAQGGARFAAPAFSTRLRGNDVSGSSYAGSGAVFIADLPAAGHSAE